MSVLQQLLLSIISLIFYLISAAAAFPAHRSSTPKLVIVGKIILDKYGPPSNNSDDDRSVTIGGGGPQAAWGAAASLAVRDYLLYASAEKKKKTNIDDIVDQDYNRDFVLSNLNYQITFLAPVGTKNWTPFMTEQLSKLIPPMVKVVLIPSADHITPTINIWHDEDENVKWMPVDGSFDNVGADGLWQNRPSAQDILRAIQQQDSDDEDEDGNNNDDILLHAIIEAGSKPTGQGLDALPFFDNKLMSRVSVAGVEPIVFADDVSGKVTCEDSSAMTTRTNTIRQSFVRARADKEKDDGNDSLFVVTPDRPCYEGMISQAERNFESNEFEMIIRDGGRGCFTNEMKMPAATLRTSDGAPVNPTGAGNAFSAAYVVCRGTGSSIKEAASIATAVGAVICEYDHLPPWSLEVIERLAEAACEVNEW